MVEVHKYQIPPTSLIPNSTRPILHYPKFLSYEGSNQIAVHANKTFSSNGWQTQWIYRYASTQASHYHSQTHECMAVLTGSATIRFGVADDENQMIQKATDEDDKEFSRVEIYAQAGDVFIIPAGVAHKTFDTTPNESFKLLTPGDGHHVATQNVEQTLSNLKLDGFTMIGAYPENSAGWDFACGGEHVGEYEKIWSVPKPDKDPVLGQAQEGICGQW